MSNIAISALPAGSALGGTEVIPMVQSGVTEVTTPNALVAYAQTVLSIMGKVSFTIGDGVSASFVLAHNLATTDVVVSVYRTGTTCPDSV